MSEPKKDFVATASKYRPGTFADILAQPGVTVTLKNALSQDRIHPAYLLCGPRGTGKTTTARVLAKALNCKKLQQGDPCTTCDPCVEFQTGKSMDVSRHARMDVWTYGSMEVRTYGRMNLWTYRLMDVRTYGRTDVWTCGREGVWTYGSMDVWM